MSGSVARATIAVGTGGDRPAPIIVQSSSSGHQAFDDPRLPDQSVAEILVGIGVAHDDLVFDGASFAVGPDGALELYDGGLRAIDKDGQVIFDHYDNQQYTDLIVEEVRSWSYMKFPFISSLGQDDGWYRVGPLARMNTADFIDTPEADAELKEFMAVTDNKPNNISMASILLGEQCGVCHCKVAFPVSDCRRCHSKNKPKVSNK